MLQAGMFSRREPCTGRRIVKGVEYIGWEVYFLRLMHPRRIWLMLWRSRAFISFYRPACIDLARIAGDLFLFPYCLRILDRIQPLDLERLVMEVDCIPLSLAQGIDKERNLLDPVKRGQVLLSGNATS